MSNRQGVAYDADNLVTLTPGSLTFNGTTYDIAASGSAAAAMQAALIAQAAAAAAQATANAALPKAGGTMTGDIDMSGTQKVTNMALPTAPGDATNKQYVDNLVTGVLRFKGSTDCSGNPNYPAAALGDAYVVSVAGKIGGAAGIVVEAGDVYFAIAANPGGTQAAVGSSWDVVQYNLVGALLSANNLSDVQNVATARTNLGLGTVAVLASDSDGTLASNSDLKVATQKATKTYADTKVAKTGDTMTGLLTITNNAVETLASIVNKGTGELALKVRTANGNVNEVGAQAGMDFGFSNTYRVTFATAANSGIGTAFNGSAYFFCAGMTNGLRFITESAGMPIEFWPSLTRAVSITGTTSRIGGTTSTNAAVTAVRGYFAPATDTTTVQIGLGDSTGYSWQMGRDNTLTGDFSIQAVSNANVAYFTNAIRIMWANGNVAFGRSTATAVLHLKAGTASANTAPLKFTAGTNLTTPEAGAIEYDGTNLYYTASTTRETLNNKVSRAGDTMTGSLAITGTTSTLAVGIAAPTIALVEFASNASSGKNVAMQFTGVVTAAAGNNTVGLDWAHTYKPPSGKNVFMFSCGSPIVDVSLGNANMVVGANFDGQYWTKSGVNTITISYAGYFSAPTIATTNWCLYAATGKSYIHRLTLGAGTAGAGNAPLVFTSGTNLTTPIAGAMEYNNTLSFTDSSAVRKDVALKTTYTPTLTPAAIGGAAYTEQTFTVTGLTTSDTVVVNGPAAAANTVLVHARVSAADSLALTWITSAAATPTSGTYRIVAIRS